MVKNPPPMQETQVTPVPSLDREDPLEEEMAAHCSILVWKTPWTEEPGGLLNLTLLHEAFPVSLNIISMHGF